MWLSSILLADCEPTTLSALNIGRLELAMYNRNRLMELIRERALKFGDFTLASGKKSTYYLHTH